MAEIDYSQVQLIVENNMRNAGFQGNFENGWKESVTINNQSYPQPLNLQNLRDIIAKSIVDAITNSMASGTISTGSQQGIPIVETDTSIINLTVGSPSLPAARKNDSVKVTYMSDPIFIGWITNISAAVNSLANGSVPYIPVSVDGKITTGSTSVQIGD